MQFQPSTKRTYEGEGAERDRQKKKRNAGRHRRLAVEKLKMMPDDIIFAAPYLSREEALEVFGEASRHTTRLETVNVEATAKIGWEPLPPGLRDGRGMMADGIVSAVQGGLTHAEDERRRPVSIRIRLLPPIEAPIREPREEPDPWEAFMPAKARAQRQVARIAPDVPPRALLRTPKQSQDRSKDGPGARTEARTGPPNEGPRSEPGSGEGQAQERAEETGSTR